MRYFNRVGGGPPKTQKRRLQLLLMLLQEGVITFSDIRREMGTRKDTLQRDLQRLEQESRLIKIVGEGQGSYVIAFPSLLMTGIEQGEYRLPTRLVGGSVSEKEAVAQRAYELVEPRDSIFVGTGSTLILFTAKLALHHRTSLDITTDSLASIDLLYHTQTEYKVSLLGGRVRGSSTTIEDEEVHREEIRHFDKSFMGFEGFVEDDNNYSFFCRPDFASKQRKIAATSDMVIFLGIHSKKERRVGQEIISSEDLRQGQKCLLVTTNEEGNAILIEVR